MIGERGESPLSFRNLEESGVEDAEVLAPQLLAGEVVDMQPFRPEERDQVRAVSRQRGVRLCALRVPLHGRHALVDRLLPPRRAGPLVQADHLPLVRAAVVDRFDVAVESGLERVVLLADRRRDAQQIAPDNRARVAEPGIFVRHAADAGVNVVGAGRPSVTTPLASMPRKAGQSTPGRGARAGPPRCCWPRGRFRGGPLSTMAVENVKSFVMGSSHDKCNHEDSKTRRRQARKHENTKKRTTKEAQPACAVFSSPRLSLRYSSNASPMIRSASSGPSRSSTRTCFRSSTL